MTSTADLYRDLAMNVYHSACSDEWRCLLAETRIHSFIPSFRHTFFCSLFSFITVQILSIGREREHRTRNLVISFFCHSTVRIHFAIVFLAAVTRLLNLYNGCASITWRHRSMTAAKRNHRRAVSCWFVETLFPTSKEMRSVRTSNTPSVGLTGANSMA